MGNFTTKDGQGYTYTGCMAGTRPAGPHAVCTVGNGPAFAYDGNGNATDTGGRTISYNAANKPVHIDSHPAVSQGNDTGTVDFIYSADGDRVVQDQGTVAGGGVARTIYVGMGATGKSLYERTTRGTTTEHVQFIYAGASHNGNAFAVRTMTDEGSGASPAVMTRYNLFDHLGSTTVVSDEGGHVVSPAFGGPSAGVLGYDPWGLRRQPDGQPGVASQFASPPGHRTFTGQEEIPNVGLINMNGRVYDPTLGRFLSADPNIPSPTDLQSYNRYAYVLNNPLRYTDPTGYWSWGWTSFAVNAALTVGAIAICAGSEGAACGVSFMLIGMAYNTTAMAIQGASVDQIVFTDLLSAFGGAYGGAIGGGVTAGLGGGAGAQILGGATAGLVSSAIGAWGAGLSGKNFGEALLIGAASGAGAAALSYGVAYVRALSQKSAGGNTQPEADAERGGAGSAPKDIDRAAAQDRINRVLRDAQPGWNTDVPDGSVTPRV